MDDKPSTGPPELSLVIPTFNERSNIAPLTAAVTKALAGIHWEIIFVDDDSPDGTCAEIAAVARDGAPIRSIRRVGRRGLASAVVEGAMSARGEIIGVMDADMQHDERILPQMLSALKNPGVDLVVGSRHAEGGGLGDWKASRRMMSAFATWSSRFLIGNSVTDPMSGFFMTRRSVFDASIYDLTQQGYKILLDILTSSPRPLAVVELPYVFRNRHSGESKVDATIVMEYAFLLVDKFTRGWIPPRFVLFGSVGALGLLVHLASLQLIRKLGLSFLLAQGGATLVAMSFNYVLNNSITYRSDRLKGSRFVVGYLLFCLVCSLGAVANISVADVTLARLGSWPIAGAAGALMSAVFNFGVASRFVWGRRHRPSARG